MLWFRPIRWRAKLVRGQSTRWLSKPIHRGEVVLGKWLGFAGLMALYVLLLAGGLVISVGVQGSYYPANLPIGIGLIYLETLLVMSVTLAFSSRLSTLATGAAVFGMYGIAFLGGWVEQIGALLQSQTAVDVGVLASLLMPSKSLWRRAAYEMTSPVLRSLGEFQPLRWRGLGAQPADDRLCGPVCPGGVGTGSTRLFTQARDL